MMKKYKKKPVIIEAQRVPVLGDYSSVTEFLSDALSLAEWCGGTSHLMSPPEDIQEGIHIPTLEGVMVGSPGDYIIKGIQGEFYPCKPDIFADSYEEVIEEDRDAFLYTEYDGSYLNDKR